MATKRRELSLLERNAIVELPEHRAGIMGSQIQFKNSGTNDHVLGTECNTSTNLWLSSFVLNDHFMEMLYCLIDDVLKQSRL